MTKFMFNVLLLIVLLLACNFDGSEKNIDTHLDANDTPVDSILPDKSQLIESESINKTNIQVKASKTQQQDRSANALPEIPIEGSSVSKSTEDMEDIINSYSLEVVDNRIVEFEENFNDEDEIQRFEKDEAITLITKVDHTIFDRVLKKFVRNGKVDYNGIKADNTFDNYLKLLATNPVENGWSGEETLAYWINAYNAFTIKLIIDNYPLKSITDLHKGKPWDVKWIKLGIQLYSLNQIENEIIRPQFKEPRIHFAVNCAALSCPPLANTAFTAENLESLLQKQTVAFINNKSFNQIGKNNVVVSKIFEWYAADFGNLISFLNQYSKTQINGNASISYNEYNWGLNSY